MTDASISKYFNMAKNVSCLSDFKKHHIGCVFVYKGRVISDGFNTMKTSPVQKQYNKYRNFNDDNVNNGALHAEMYCLSRCKDMDVDWSKVHVFVYREHKNGISGLAKPCKACETALREIGIKKVYYTGENSTIYERYD